MQGIRIRGLVKRYPNTTDLFGLLRHPFAAREGTTALHGIDLTLEPGRIYGLVGPNGAGKTTLLKIVAGLVLPDEGTIELDETTLDSRSRRARNAIGYVVSEERSFHWRLTVRENLRFFGVLEQVDDPESRATLCLDRVGMLEHADRSFRELSTGMRQRVALARGLLGDPRVLLMDEATRSLDPLAADDLRAVLRELFPVGSERTLVYSTHNLAEVEVLCTDLVVLRKGRVTARRDLVAGGGALDSSCYTLRTRRPIPGDVLAAIDGIERLGEREGAVSVRVATEATLDGLVACVHAGEYGLLELRNDPWIEDLLREEPVQ